MATSNIILSNTKIILDNDESKLSEYKEAVDFIIDIFMSNREERDIKIYLVDNIEGSDIFDNIITPLVNYYLEIFNSADYSSMIPYFSLYVETNKETYTQEQLEFLKNNSVYFVQEFSNIPNEEYLTLLGTIYSTANVKIMINDNTINNLFNIINSLINSNLYYLNFDVNWAEYVPTDFATLQEQLNLYKDLIIQAFEDYTVPPMALNIDNAFCKLVIAYHEQQNGTVRSTPISTFSYREGTGSLGDYVIKNGNIYLNKYCFDTDVFKIGKVYDDIDFTIIDAIQNEASYTCNLCEKCYMNRICNNGNPGINYLLGEQYNTMNQSYCTWQSLIMSIAQEIVSYFDTNQDNELFQAYFAGATQRGVKVEY